MVGYSKADVCVIRAAKIERLPTRRLFGAVEWGGGEMEEPGRRNLYTEQAGGGRSTYTLMILRVMTLNCLQVRETDKVKSRLGEAVYKPSETDTDRVLPVESGIYPGLWIRRV
jgi:hypothetical protein